MASPLLLTRIWMRCGMCSVVTLWMLFILWISWERKIKCFDLVFVLLDFNENSFQILKLMYLDPSLKLIDNWCYVMWTWLICLSVVLFIICQWFNAMLNHGRYYVWHLRIATKRIQNVILGGCRGIESSERNWNTLNVRQSEAVC